MRLESEENSSSNLFQPRNPAPWRAIDDADDEIAKLMDAELNRQRHGLEMIASENFASPGVIAAMANTFCNKYAEGLPGKRYYGGCEIVDQMETICIERAKTLFNAKFANVQAHSGAQANAAVYLSLCQSGDKVLGLDLSHGGHLTHGSPVNFSGILYHACSYQLDPQTEQLNYDEIRAIAKKERPKLIIAGASAYSRVIDFAAFRAIADEVGAFLFVDMAHIAGLVAAGVHPSPLPHAHVVTTTTHKTLRGPRGGLILWNDSEMTARLNKGVFPGTQGGPLEHMIAAKAVAFKEALSPSYRAYQQQVVNNAQALARGFLQRNFKLVSGGTDNHLMLMNLTETPVSGKDLEQALGLAGITVNKNTVPYEKRSPFVTSGVRFGTPALTTRGMGGDEMDQIAELVRQVFDHIHDEPYLRKLAHQVQSLAERFPLYKGW